MKKYYDFKCSCACGTRLRILPLAWKNGVVMDIGLMKRGERRPKFGVVLRSDENDDIKTLIKILQRKITP